MNEIEARADLIFTVVQTVFAMVLAPTLRDQYRQKASTVPLWTSLTTAIGLFVLAVTQFSLGLEVASVTAVISGSLWLAVAGQRMAYGA